MKTSNGGPIQKRAKAKGSNAFAPDHVTPPQPGQCGRVILLKEDLPEPNEAGHTWRYVTVEVDGETRKVVERYCANPPVDGATVCVMHGGRAKQVRAAAEVRVTEREAARRVERLGLRKAVSATEALQDALERQAGTTEYLGDRVAELGTEAYWGDDGLIAIVRAYDSSVFQQHVIAKAGAQVGLAERRQQLDEDLASVFVALLAGVFQRLEYQPDPELLSRAISESFTEVSAKRAAIGGEVVEG